jgi:predicted ATPase/transcriptional regulator with XRE-family HTH domain
MDDTRTFGRWLKEQRASLGLTQEQLADRIGYSVETIHKIEAGKRRPSRQAAELLVAALGLPPEDRVEFIRRLRATLPPTTPPDAAGTPSLPGMHTAGAGRGRNLPIPPTPLIGRETELARLRELLLTNGARLVTLVGPPGIGKTRLAVAAAYRLRDEFPDGVCFVELAPLTNPELVPATIVAALGLAAARAALPERVGGYLRDKRLLLVLDNCEHLPAVAEQVDRLLQAAAGLQVLATSRTPLGIYGEQEYPVPALCVPDLQTTLAPAELEHYEGVRLFVARVRDIDPGFALTPEEGPAVAAICARLDGLPLAIELAAARVRLQPPPALLARHGAPLEWLRGGPVTRPVRQQTLWDAIAWSYDLLGADEQRLFRRLAVFQGGATLEAIAAVCGEGQEASSATLALVESLVGKSLLRHRAGQAAPRLGMLETIKEYAGAQLAASGEGEQVHLRHARFYLQTAYADNQLMSAAEHIPSLALLEDEQDNLRAALDWVLEARTPAQQAELALAWRVGGDLARYWLSRGRRAEGRRWIEALLAREADAAGRADIPPEAFQRGKAGLLYARGAATRWQSPEARPFWEQSLGLYRELGDRERMGLVLWYLINLVIALGDLAAGQTLGDEYLAISREAHDTAGIVSALSFFLVIAKRQGDPEQARTLAQQALATARQVDDSYNRAYAVGNIASTLANEWDFAAAAPVWEELRGFDLDHGFLEEMGYALCGLGQCAYAQGNFGSARRLYRQALVPRLSRPVFDYIPPYFIVQLAGVEMEIALRAMAQRGLAASRRRRAPASAASSQETAPAVARAVRLLGAGAALLDDELDLIEQAPYDFVAATAQDILGEPAFAAALTQGRAMTAEQAYAYALAGAGEPDGDGPDPDARFDGAPPPAYLIAPTAAGIELPGAGHADTTEL